MRQRSVLRKVSYSISAVSYLLRSKALDVKEDGNWAINEKVDNKEGPISRVLYVRAALLVTNSTKIMG